MATNTRTLVQAFTRAIGIDPNIVSGISMRADARDAILRVTVEVIPQVTVEQLDSLFATLKEYKPETAFDVRVGEEVEEGD